MGFPRRVDWSDGGRLITRGRLAQCPYCHRTNVVIWASGEPNHQHRESWACRADSNRLTRLELEAVKNGTRDAKTGARRAPRRRKNGERKP